MIFICRYVATRVVERVYFQLPPSPTPTVKNNEITSTNDEDLTTATTTTSNTTTTTLNTTSILSSTKCQAENYVLFLKTHKTGSSTITNILNRFADSNNLTVLLPNDATFYSFNWPNKFRLSYAKDNHGHMPNILANHARYSRKSMNVLFPRERTSYVTILREPVKQWESTFSYMSFPYILNIYKKEDPLDFFLNNPPSIENIRKIARRYPSIYLIKNPLFFDLGLDFKDFDNLNVIRRAINTIDKDFDLVLMMEHFDESMVLMKRRLCWDIDDVIFFKTNERLNKNKRRTLTSEQEKMIKKWNNADIALYEYFMDKFWKEIEKEGEEFYDDLQELKERKKYYFNACVSKETVTKAYSSVYVKGYEMRKNLTTELKLFCERMLRNELSYQDHFKAKYKKKVDGLEGNIIRNFDDQFEEAEVNITQGSKWAEEGESFDYGLPTKSPAPTKSRFSQKRFRQDSTKQYLKSRKSNIKEPAKDTEEGKVNKKGSRIKSKKRENSVSNDNDMVKTEMPTKEPKTTSPTKPMTLKSYKKEELTTLQKHMELEKKSGEKFEGKGVKIPNTTPRNELIFTKEVAKKEGKAAKNIEATITPSAKMMISETRQVITEENDTERAAKEVPAKTPIVTESSNVSTVIKRKKLEAEKDYIRYKEKVEPMESSNDELDKDDPRRYDGKTIITSKNKTVNNDV